MRALFLLHGFSCVARARGMPSDAVFFFYYRYMGGWRRYCWLAVDDGVVVVMA